MSVYFVKHGASCLLDPFQWDGHVVVSINNTSHGSFVRIIRYGNNFCETFNCIPMSADGALTESKLIQRLLIRRVTSSHGFKAKKERERERERERECM